MDSARGICISANKDETSLEPELAQLLKNQTGAFSFSAGKALDLNSVFYMSALLYPEDYADGDTNDLENFIIQLENSY